MSRRRLLIAAPALAAVLGACRSERFDRVAEARRAEVETAARAEAEGFAPVGREATMDGALGKAPARILTLAECERIAVRNNLAYRTRLLETRLSDEQARSALSALLPRGTAELTAKRRSNEPLVAAGTGVAAFEDQETRAFSLGLILPIFDFGATWYAWSAAQDVRDQERLAATRARQTLIRDVRVAYAQLAGALRDVELTQAEVAAAAEAHRTARSLEREGLSTAADTSFVEARAASAELGFTLARRDLLLARSALARTLSIPVWSDFGVDPKLPDPPPPPRTAGEVQDLERAAVLARPELHAHDLERSIADARVRRAFAEFFPRLDATPDFDWSSNSRVVNPAFFTGGLTVAHALLDGSATLSRYRAAGAQVDVERERALLVAMSVTYEVDLRVLELSRAWDGIAAGERLVEAQERLAREVRAQHREGLGSGADLARAVADEHAARRELNRTRT
ncbi:MAG TPA: TolC family protein, partial [Planctomycetota bacterium]|nr:TolC family protein [Planctomycetota bacterium]